MLTGNSIPTNDPAQPERAATPARPRSMASSSIWPALSHVATLEMQGVRALVILLVFGKGTGRCSLPGLYWLVVLMCQTLRLSFLAQLAEGPSGWAAFDRFLGAGLSIWRSP